MGITESKIGPEERVLPNVPTVALTGPVERVLPNVPTEALTGPVERVLPNVPTVALTEVQLASLDPVMSIYLGPLRSIGLVSDLQQTPT